MPRPNIISTNHYLTAPAIMTSHFTSDIASFGKYTRMILRNSLSRPIITFTNHYVTAPITVTSQTPPVLEKIDPKATNLTFKFPLVEKARLQTLQA